MNGIHDGGAPSLPKSASLSIDFIIVGGGIAGLACAVALRRVGHRVLVLEREESFDSAHKSPGGTRMPPNMTKIFYHWGMGDEVKRIAAVSERVFLHRFDSGNMLGAHRWDKEMLNEAGGEFMFLHHGSLHRMLYETALELGARIRTRAEVVSVDVEGRSVTLTTGEVIQGDVIVGADGAKGLCRETVVGPNDPSKPTGLMMFNAVIPGQKMHSVPELATILRQDLVTQFVWFGDHHCALCFRIGHDDDCAFYFYAPDDGSSSSDVWDDIVPPEVLLQHVRGAEPRLQKLASLASSSRMQVTERTDLDDWVHDDGPLLLVGEAAHPFPPGAIQAGGMSVEDASVLAKLFSHLRSHDQIESFLYAFQDLRQARCSKNRVQDMANIYFMTLPEGEQTELRDATMREKHDRGLNVLDTDEDDGNSAQWDEIREIFGYDAEDEADNWWVQWGLLRERAKAANSGVEFAMDIQIHQCDGN
ncbi:hypothetical protein EW146_g7059 [Bondarzewia mesenterica]|uniref:FAD-binding domain-containing protein n=1 Tax=Bondarzewia mesenterica TaxID=1095465 RepID=A0A4S4LML3_9AGAM|nr:hypothetical protein EW146_g7059 [Bondarzewia mesenterica]